MGSQKEIPRFKHLIWHAKQKQCPHKKRTNNLTNKYNGLLCELNIERMDLETKMQT